MIGLRVPVPCKWSPRPGRSGRAGGPLVIGGKNTPDWWHVHGTGGMIKAGDRDVLLRFSPTASSSSSALQRCTAGRPGSRSGVSWLSSPPPLVASPSLFVPSPGPEGRLRVQVDLLRPRGWRCRIDDLHVQVAGGCRPAGRRWTAPPAPPARQSGQRAVSWSPTTVDDCVVGCPQESRLHVVLVFAA